MTQHWTSYMHNAGTEVSEWAKAEYNMHKKKLCSTAMTAYAAMCNMVRYMVSACVCKGNINYSPLGNLVDTFENAHKDMNGYRDRELVWVLGE